jgi:ElaB/YqjD/DUF883 family membrane-anchored ribosome-binding protein
MTDKDVQLLVKALADLIREASAVADDHHVPRYARLDQALDQARETIAKIEGSKPCTGL